MPHLLPPALAALMVSDVASAACGVRGLEPIPLPPPDPEMPVEILGAACLPVEVLQDAAGPPSLEDPLKWVDEAAQRVVALYAAQGFPAARVWARVEKDGAVQLAVDEGHVDRITFVGVNAIEKVLYADNLDLPGGLVHAPTLEASLERLRDAHAVKDLGYSLFEGDEFVPNAFGKAVPERILQVWIREGEERGFDYGVGVQSPWGLVFDVGYTANQVAMRRDTLRPQVRLALPFHQYVLQEEATFQWVYGKVGLDYGMTPFAGSNVRPLFTTRASLSRFQRPDLGIDSVLVNQNGLQAALVITLSDVVDQTFGARVENAVVTRPIMLRGEPPLDEEPFTVRGTLVAGTRAHFDDGTLRRDLQDELEVELTIAFDGGTEPLFRNRATAQWVISLGPHDLLLRNRTVFHDGNVRFYHQSQLADSYQKVQFGDAFWVQRATSTEVALRLRASHNVKLGVWHDLSYFEDLNRRRKPWAWANGAGGGLHLLVLAAFAADIYYGAGFSPVGFSHNLHLQLRSVY